MLTSCLEDWEKLLRDSGTLVGPGPIGLALVRRLRPLSRASGFALFVLTAGRPDTAVGWLLICRELGLLADEISWGLPAA